MKKLIHTSTEREWYLIDEWKTKSGLNARIQQCVWNAKVKSLAPSLGDFYTGYVQTLDSFKATRKQTEKLDVHGGVTFTGGSILGTEGNWIGFDTAHYGDEEYQKLDYVKEQCETLAEQIKNL